MKLQKVKDIQSYNNLFEGETRKICELLKKEIDNNLLSAESKIWHAHPVWFLEGNPIVGYSKEKRGLRLMFWSGASFEDTNLISGTGKFKDASVFYNKISEVNTKDLRSWLKKSQTIQWDYKNIVKRRGKLERIK